MKEQKNFVTEMEYLLYVAVLQLSPKFSRFSLNVKDTS